jgi:uncharacterized protein YifN (PemK superfamily)
MLKIEPTLEEALMPVDRLPVKALLMCDFHLLNTRADARRVVPHRIKQSRRVVVIKDGHQQARGTVS